LGLVHSVCGILSQSINVFSLCMLNQVLMRATSRLHDWLFSAIMRAPVSFFDLTPRGRIVNRFSRDMDESTNFTVRST